MRRPLTFAVLTVLGAFALAPAAEARAPRAVLVACDRADRAAVFEGRMDVVDGAARMQMRFRLEAAEPGDGRWRRVAATGFSAWGSAAAGRSRYVFTRRVEQLLAPASYRVRVRFRWLDAAGAVIATAGATSRPCRQPDPRPDLMVSAIAVRPAASPSDRRYIVTIRNDGRGGAPPTTVSLALGGGAWLAAPVAALAPGERDAVVFVAPACAPGTPLVATADAGDAVDERDEVANTLTAGCPAS
jgi:hypothetical protein